MVEPYSYFQAGFVAFYDTMVQECYGGTKAADTQTYCSMLDRLISSCTGDCLVVDLGCGTGRAVLAMLEHLAAVGGRQAPSTGPKVQLLGIDNSALFLKAAETKSSAVMQQHPVLRSTVAVSWQLGSFQDWKLQENALADFILVAGAGLHHVTTTAGLVQSLQCISDNLSQNGIAVISYLPWKQLYRADDAIPGQTAEEFNVSGYKRVLASRRIEHCTDNSCVLHERFTLSKLGNDSSPEWCIEEGWQLRKLERDELIQLAKTTGLVPSNKSWAACIDDVEHGSCWVALEKPGDVAA